jgi:hypothetical protein
MSVGLFVFSPLLTRRTHGNRSFPPVSAHNSHHASYLHEIRSSNDRVSREDRCFRCDLEALGRRFRRLDRNAIFQRKRSPQSVEIARVFRSLQFSRHFSVIDLPDSLHLDDARRPSEIRARFGIPDAPGESRGQVSRRGRVLRRGATGRSDGGLWRTVISFPPSFNALKRGGSYHPVPSRVAHLLSLLSFAADGEATGGSKSINVRRARSGGRPINFINTFVAGQ